MTTRPVIEADKGVNTVLTSSEYDVNVLQLARYLLELIDGTNADKIASAALPAELDLPGSITFPTGVVAPTTDPAIYNNTDGYMHFDNPFGETGWRFVYNGTVMMELSYLGVLKLAGFVAHRVTGGVSAGVVVPTNGSVAFTVTLDDAITPTRATATVFYASAGTTIFNATITSLGSGTVSGVVSCNGTGATVTVHVMAY